MKKKLLILFLCHLTTVLYAQSPEAVVREYVRLLNDWLVNPNAFDKRQKVIDILTDPSGNCTMSDEIVEKYNSNAGVHRCSRDTYLSILSEKAKKTPIQLSILTIKNIEYQSDKDVVTITIKYSGGIVLTTTTEFWIFDNKIGFIDKGRSVQSETIEKIVEKEKPVYIEKEKVIEVPSKDQNTGKAYLILKISEPNAEVYVNYHTYRVNGKSIQLNLPYGRYDVRVSKPTFETNVFSVNLSGEPIEKNVMLKPAIINVTVEKEGDAFLYVDGKAVGKYQTVVPVTADTRHKFKVEKNGYSKTKSVRAYQKPFTIIMPNVIHVEKIPSGWFMGLNISPELKSYGMTLGKCKNTGIIFNFGFSPLALNTYFHRNNELGSLLDTFRIRHITPIDRLNSKLFYETKNMGLYRSYARLGLIFKTFNFLYLYGTAGYGTYANVKEYSDSLFSSDIHKGFEGELGIMFRYKRIGLSFSSIQSKAFSDYSIGLHYWMKVQRKQANPINRFFVGYKVSTATQYGLSMGVSFGYYEKWGLMLHGGFAKYSLKMWKAENPIDDFFIGEIRTVSLSEQKEMGKYSNRGVFRSYYHIGPFFRLNNVFAYYITLGYGNYAKIKYFPEHNYETDFGTYSLYATKVHNGVDGEVGFMLKIWRLGLSIGYQHNVGKQNLFQDVSVGAYIWLGK